MGATVLAEIPRSASPRLPPSFPLGGPWDNPRHVVTYGTSTESPAIQTDPHKMSKSPVQLFVAGTLSSPVFQGWVQLSCSFQLTDLLTLLFQSLPTANDSEGGSIDREWKALSFCSDLS
ncbi:hypothetical protein ILYODFUR_029563 [Ilyodon furcidens]|uniref:Uncharacterized protein n=1 Tax=Ilyodon furcidens TaxID=33524 RepID=A0ABV0V8U0_9TELE